jgi:hypothetical protein
LNLFFQENTSLIEKLEIQNQLHLKEIHDLKSIINSEKNENEMISQIKKLLESDHITIKYEYFDYSDTKSNVVNQ